VKPQVAASAYLPLGTRTTLALSVRLGRIFGFEDSFTIAPKRFYMGGTNSLRGYPEDGVPPEDTRDALKSQLADCNRLANSNLDSGCTDAAQILRAGNTVPSEGGQAFVLYKAELRFPISGSFEGALFVDAGNLWLQADLMSFKPEDLKVTPGFGLRYGTPVGPLALDLGFNPFPDPKLNETAFSASYIQFSIGLF
jgi:outer membrane protein assembly factor BamA